MHYLKAPTSKKLRIDAAGYQASIIDYCFENDIGFIGNDFTGINIKETFA
jgi:hypothetical protein